MGTGDNILIGGFIINGTESKQVVVRGIGPSLAVNGVPLVNRLADPAIDLYQGNTLIMTNNNWKDSQQAEIEATGIPPSDDLESAIIATLAPGSYTAILRGNNGETGNGVFEVYDLDAAAKSMLANVSARGLVQTGDDVLIAGFIIGRRRKRYCGRQGSRAVAGRLGNRKSFAGSHVGSVRCQRRRHHE